MITNNKILNKIKILLIILTDILLLSCSSTILTINKSNKGILHSKIMLVLGSNKPAVRKERINLACDLIKKKEIQKSYFQNSLEQVQDLQAYDFPF